jgi:hypothetical protein
MAKRTPEVDKLYESGYVYPDYFPELVQNEMMMYHRIANAQKIHRRQLHLGIRRMKIYSFYLNKWLSEEMLRPKFVASLSKIMIIKQMLTGFDEFSHYWNMLRDIIGRDEGGVFLD